MASRIRLRNQSADAIALREFASGFCRRNGLPSDEHSRLLVILDELFSNVVSYGYPSQGPGRIEVTLSLDGNRLVIKFVDDGVRFDPLARPEADLSLPMEDRPIGGIGITIVRALVDEIGYVWQRNRNCLTLSRRITPPADRAGEAPGRASR